jgi:hypothetical protein
MPRCIVKPGVVDVDEPMSSGAAAGIGRAIVDRYAFAAKLLVEDLLHPT